MHFFRFGCNLLLSCAEILRRYPVEGDGTSYTHTASRATLRASCWGTGRCQKHVLLARQDPIHPASQIDGAEDLTIRNDSEPYPFAV